MNKQKNKHIEPKYPIIYFGFYICGFVTLALVGFFLVMLSMINDLLESEGIIKPELVSSSNNLVFGLIIYIVGSLVLLSLSLITYKNSKNKLRYFLILVILFLSLGSAFFVISQK